MRARLAVVAVLALVGGLALAGCRADPKVAAYHGDRAYTVREVDRLVSEGRDPSEPRRGVERNLVLSWLLIRDAAGAAARERGLAMQPADPAQIALQTGLPAESSLVKLFAEVRSVIEAFSTTVEPAEPTEADQREVFTSLTIEGQRIANSFEQVRPALTKEAIGRELALRSVLGKVMEDSDVVINPRFAPLTYPVSVQIRNASGFVSVPISVEKSPVRDRV